MGILTTSNTSPRWYPLWVLHRRSFFSGAISAASTGTQKVSVTLLEIVYALLNTSGNWIAVTPIPDQTLEMLEKRHVGREKELLLALARKILRWLPEDRPSAEDLFDDEYLNLFRVENEAGVAQKPTDLRDGVTVLWTVTQY